MIAGKYETIGEFVRDHVDSFYDVMFTLGVIATDETVSPDVVAMMDVGANAIVQVMRGSDVDLTFASKRTADRFDQMNCPNETETPKT